MSRTIFNELGENRVINPRSGFSQFVDLSSNQIIGGIKRFLNNLITNSDVNFNTTANVGRIIFYPNEPPGSGSQIVSIYTEDENDGHGWFFDSVGNLYYLGGGIAPVKIMLAGATGDLTILSNFNGFGDIICHNILTSNIISSYSGGDITFNNGIALGSNTINSGNITSTGTISGVDISSTGIIFANDVNLTSTGYLNVNNITSSVASGSYQTKISLSNEFIDVNNSSLDIVATYIGFASPAQTLSTTSKYMFIKPLSTGDFEMLMNNIANKILISDWATTKISSQFIWNLNNASNITNISLDAITTSGNRLQIYGVASGTKYLYYNISNELGVIDGATSQWKITGIGEATFSSLSVGSGPISTSGNISCGAITATSLTTSGGRKKSTTMYQISVTLGLNNHVVVLYGNSMNITCTLPSSPINGQEYYITCQDSFYTVTLSSITSPILSPFGTLYYSASMVKGSYVHLIFVSTTGYWSMISGNIAGFSTSGKITGGLITGTSISAGTGPISTTGAIGGGAITGTSLSAGTGPISTTGGNISGGAISGSSLTAGSGPISTTGPIDGGAITGTSLTAGSGPISTTGNISGVDITSTNIIYAKSINMQPIGFLNVNNITSSATTGSYPTAIALSNEFIDTGNSSLDIIATYIGFGNPQQTLSTASKYMFIKPLSDGNFEIQINDIASKVFSTNWSTLTLTSDFNLALGSKTITTTGTIEGGDINANGALSLRNTSSLTNILLNPTTTSGNRLLIYGITSGTKFLYYNTSNNIGVYNTITGANVWSIDGTTGNFNTIGTISGGAINGTTINASSSFISDLITASTGTATKNSIMMNNQFIDATNGSIDLKAHYVGFPYITESLSILSKYMFIKPLSDGNFQMQINNVVGKLLYTDFTNKIIKTDWSWKWYDASGIFQASILNTGDIAGKTLTASGNITSTAIIQTTGTITAPTTKTTLIEAILLNTYRNKIEMSNLYANASIGEIDIISQYIAVVHPSNALSTLAKYGFFRTQTNGDTDFNINNISGTVWGTRFSNREFYTDFTFQCQKAGFTSGYLFSKFSNSGGVIGSISMFSASEVRFNQTSDYRLKQDIIDIPNPLERLLKLKPKNYRYIKNVEENDFRISEGFIAHEVEEILPSAVSGTKDDPENFQMLDYSSFTPLLTGAVQELNKKVDEQQILIDNQQILIDNQQILIDSLIKRLEILELNNNLEQCNDISSTCCNSKETIL